MSKNTKKILLVVAVTILVIGTFFLVNTLIHSDTSSEQKGVSQPTVKPPTKAEENAGDIKKEEIIDNENTAENLPTTANVIIVDANQYDSEIEIRAYISNIYEDGSCNITLTQNKVQIVKKVSAFKDATTTQCSPVSIPRAEIPSSGLWTVSVTYVSDNLTGNATSTVVVK